MTFKQKLSAISQIVDLIEKLPKDARQWIVWRVTQMAEQSGLSLRPPSGGASA